MPADFKAKMVHFIGDPLGGFLWSPYVYTTDHFSPHLFLISYRHNPDYYETRRRRKYTNAFYDW